MLDPRPLIYPGYHFFLLLCLNFDASVVPAAKNQRYLWRLLVLRLPVVLCVPRNHNQATAVQQFVSDASRRESGIEREGRERGEREREQVQPPNQFLFPFENRDSSACARVRGVARWPSKLKSSRSSFTQQYTDDGRWSNYNTHTLTSLRDPNIACCTYL